MKKSLLLLVAGALTMAASAQNSKSVLVQGANNPHKEISKVRTSDPTAAAAPRHSAERTTSTCTISEDFSSGTYTTLPTGWTAGTLSGPGTWHWANSASSTTYSIGAIRSTTASNGWMIFDSDSLAGGTGTGTVVPSGWLQSPAYNCSSLATVRLTFEEYYERFQDSCFVQVGTTPTGPFTTYAVALNNGLASNSSTANPATVHINISSAAAGHATVYIRFLYDGPPAGGYSWMIDDICVGPLDAHDIGIGSSFVYEPNCIATPGAGAYDGSMFNTPLEFVDSIYPVTLLTNYGSNAEPSVTVNASIYNTSGSVYTGTPITYSAPLDAYDSVVQFNGYLPSAIGNYVCAFSSTLAGDADATNNIDSVAFNVTDTLWQENLGSVSLGGGYYVYKSGTSPLSFYQGTRFDVPCGATPDTVSGFGVAFSNQSLATGTGKVSVQLYSVDKAATGWSYQGTSVARSLTTSNYNTTSSIVWADFRDDISTGVSQFILQPGTTYAAMIQINGLSSNLIVSTTTASNATGYSGYFGQSATSLNDGGTDFGSTTIATGSTSYVPMIRMYTGHLHLPSAVQNISLDNTIGDAYPNPANSDVTIPITMSRDNKVTVTLTDVMGQVVNTQNINAIGGQQSNAVFPTSNLANGIYLYSVQANNERTTGRVVVAH